MTPEYAGWASDPCPSTHRSSPPRCGPSTTSRSAAPARKSATTASIAIPQPAIAIPVCPVGTKTDFEAALPRGEVELDGDGLLPDRAVGADGEDDLGRDLEVLAGGDAELGRRLPEVAQLDAVLPRERRSARGRRLMNSCSPLSRSRPARIASFSSSRQAGGKRPPWVATPTVAVVGP